MKKLSLFLAAALLLASCQAPSAPVNESSSSNPTSSQDEIPSSKPKEESQAPSADAEEVSVPVSANIPMPEEMPAGLHRQNTLRLKAPAISLSQES